jgi:hypothetical protein
MDSGKKLISDSLLSGQGRVPTSGWDPYDVWRTRILLPRLAEQEAERCAKIAAGKRLYVVASSGKTADEPAPTAPSPAASLDASDDALKREMIDVLGSLLAIGLASAFYGERDRKRQALLPLSRAVPPRR